MPKVAVVFAPGCEEVEGLTVIDVLRRLGIDAKMVGLEDREVLGAHNIKLTCDELMGDQLLKYDLVAFPGGMGGSKRLRDNEQLKPDVVLSYEKHILRNYKGERRRPGRRPYGLRRRHSDRVLHRRAGLRRGAVGPGGPAGMRRAPLRRDALHLRLRPALPHRRTRADGLHLLCCKGRRLFTPAPRFLLGAVPGGGGALLPDREPGAGQVELRRPDRGGPGLPHRGGGRHEPGLPHPVYHAGAARAAPLVALPGGADGADDHGKSDGDRQIGQGGKRRMRRGGAHGVFGILL